MNVFIITEGNAQAGYGHLTRCLALYQGIEERGIIPVFIADCDQNGEKVLNNVTLESYDWIGNPDRLMAQISGADFAIIDSYLAEFSIYEQIYQSVKKTAYFDDTLRLDYPPGIVINGAVNAEALPYSRIESHIYLLGLEYTPMRKAFWDIPKRKTKEKIENVLITMGGNDLRGITVQVLDALVKEFPHLKYHVVSRPGNFKRNTETSPDLTKINYYHSLDADEMRNLMLDCDIAITGAGQTSYEVIKAGLIPIFVQVAENQHVNIQGWYDRGVIRETISIEQENYLFRILDSMQNVQFERPEIWRDRFNSTVNLVQGILDVER